MSHLLVNSSKVSFLARTGTTARFQYHHLSEGVDLVTGNSTLLRPVQDTTGNHLRGRVQGTHAASWNPYQPKFFDH